MASRSFSTSLLLGLLYQTVGVLSQAALDPITAAPSFVKGASAPSGSALPDLESAGSDCNGCYLIADVAGLVWYNEVFVNMATAMVQVGGNGSAATTRTSILQDEGAFTFSPDQNAPGGGGVLTQVAFDPTVNVAGAVLRSPTAYNVFTAYSITSEYSANGACQISSGKATTLASAYSEPVSSANGKVYLDAAGQQQFINFLGFSSCSGGGENYKNTALIPVQNTTVTSTTRFTNLPALVSATLSIAPKSTPASTTASFPTAGVPAIVIGNSTITPVPTPIGLPVYNGTIPAATTKVVPSGSGSGSVGTVTPGAPVPFVGLASNLKPNGFFVAWIAGMVGFGGLVYYL